VLTQIGLGYVFLFLLGWTRPQTQGIAAAALLAGYWAAFALYPLPPAGVDTASVGVRPDWPHQLTGFAAHWNKNTNLAWAFDNWWLNLFPRETPFQYNGGGYATLSFIPTLGTMILGLIAGGWLKSDLSAHGKMKRFLIAGVAGLAAGWLLDLTGICPNVKRIWTPAWALFSGGWCFLFLAFFHWVMDVKGWKLWAFPLTVIGMNSIFAYCSEWLFVGFLRDSVQTNFGVLLTTTFGEFAAEFAGRVAALVIVWLMLLWLYRKKVFIKI
jgi:predicted acyltransferase